MILSPIIQEEEISKIMDTYGAYKDEIIHALTATLRKVTKRNITLVKNDLGDLVILRVNKNDTTSQVSSKVLKKARNIFIEKLNKIGTAKDIKTTLSMFHKGELYQGVVLNSTPNGYFVALKGRKAFISKRFLFEDDSLKEDGAYTFEVSMVTSNGKIYLTRKSNKVFEELISSIAGRLIKIKRIKKGFLAFVDKPYLEDSKIEMIKASVPVNIVFKKIKE